MIILQRIKIRYYRNAIASCYEAGHGVVFFYVAGNLQMDVGLVQEFLYHLAETAALIEGNEGIRLQFLQGNRAAIAQGMALGNSDN